MSRHLLLDRPDRQIVLGFDHMLRSFFGQVFRPDDPHREGIAVDGWPTKSGLGTRRPPEAGRELARELLLLQAWATHQLALAEAFSPEANEHVGRLAILLLREWDEGEDAATLPLPACLRGAQAIPAGEGA